MSRRVSLVLSLAIAGLLSAGVSDALAQPDPFRPLKPEAAKRPANEAAAASLVPSSHTVSVVVESAKSQRQREKISAALSRECNADFQDAPLSEVIDYLTSSCGVPIILDNRALDDIGLGSDAPLTVNFQGISLRSVLRLMLRDLDLTYVVADEVLQITTVEAAEGQLVQHVYLVDDLAVAQGPSRLGWLAELIVQAICSDTWSAAGGPGVIVPVDHLGVIVVSQTSDVHERIADLIVTLRRVREMQAQKEALR